jgi:hypothetical protein
MVWVASVWKYLMAAAYSPPTIVICTYTYQMRTCKFVKLEIHPYSEVHNNKGEESYNFALRTLPLDHRGGHQYYMVKKKEKKKGRRTTIDFFLVTRKLS